MKKALAVFVIVACALAFGESTPTAAERYRNMQKQLQAAFAAKDWKAAHTILTEMRQFKNGSTRETYNLACVEALSGNKDEAFRLLHSIAATRQFIDVAQDEDLASLRGDPRFEQLTAALKKNLEPVSSSKVVYEMGDPELLTEDIAYDPQSRSYFVTSVLRKTITRIDTVRNKLSLFADLSRDPGWPLMAIAVDPKRRVLWVTAAAVPEFVASPQADYGKDVLLKLDLKSGKILERFAIGDSGQHTMGDMTLMRDGSVMVSDGRGGGVYRLQAGASRLERIDSEEFLSPQTPALSTDEKYLFVPDYSRGIGRVDLATGKLTWLAHGDSVAMGGIDGLYFHGQDLIAVQNGASPARIVRFRLNAALDRIESMDVLESNSPGLGDPTHGVFVGDDFYFIANSGWSELDDKGKLKPGHTMTAATIRKITIK